MTSTQVEIAKPLASRLFTTNDQEQFAQICGDRNPMHMDPLAARRTQAGAPVVTDFCVRGFFDLCQSLAELSDAPIAILSPSSIAVAERAPDRTEYAMAKSAGEILCADINRYLRGVKIIVKRFPGIETDQTASVIPVPRTDECDPLLPILREMRTYGHTV